MPKPRNWTKAQYENRFDYDKNLHDSVTPSQAIQLAALMVLNFTLLIIFLFVLR